jgi:hypothetical protein
MPMFRPLVGGKEAFILCSQGCRSAAPADRVVTC